MSIRIKWVLALLLFAGLFIYAGSTCETQIYDTQPCSTHYDKAAGIAALIALAGFFLLPALVKPDNRPEEQQPSTSSADAYEQLERLARLRAEGTITDEEFDREKARLLDPDSKS